MSNAAIIASVIGALAVGGGGAAYYFLSSEKPTPAASVQKKQSEIKETDCKTATVVVPKVGLVAGVGVTAAVAACQ
tara:strand:+ start:2591 stop:2818 length:228 start_codon:yes stop_codon:yes gene_type:complete